MQFSYTCAEVMIIWAKHPHLYHLIVLWASNTHSKIYKREGILCLVYNYTEYNLTRLQFSVKGVEKL